MTTSETTIGPSDPRPVGRINGAGIVGNILEWYDYALYGYLATIIAGQFFPSADPLAGLISTYGVFAIGFLARPIGGALYGIIGDRLGRRRLLAISVVMMGVPTFALGLLPTYADVGVLAPILLVLVRFVQGLSAGGEFTGSIIFLVEHAPAHRRNLYGSLAYVGSVVGGMLGAGVAWLATTFIPEAELHDWGWRLPFLTGVVIVAGGLWLRLGVPETPTFSELKAQEAMDRKPLRTALRDHPREIAITAGFNWTMSTGYYVVFVWLASDLSKIVGLPLSTSLAIATGGLFFGALATPAASLIADRIGERAVLAVAGIVMTLAAVPLLLLAGIGSVLTATAAQLLLALAMAGFMGTLPSVFVALNRATVRCSAVAAGYNLSVTLFGGTAPLIATALVKVSGWQAAPGLYLSATALVGLALLRFLPRGPVRTSLAKQVVDG